MLHADRKLMQYGLPQITRWARQVSCAGRGRFLKLASVALACAALSGCPSTPVQQPSKPAPAPAPVPEAPVARPTPVMPNIGQLQQVALLLPLSGRQQAAGIAVRDGFFAAYYQSQRDANAPRHLRIRIYDTADGKDVAGTYLRAIDDGAQFVIGPLTKEEVATTAAIGDGRVPTLALNVLADSSKAPPGFFQFALAPEEEAQQVAQRAIADKRAHGVALVPSGDWGERVLAAFEQELTALGGQLIARGTYDPADSDHSATILRLLRLTDSRERHAKLAALLGTKLEFEPRRRGDIQFIFVAGMPSQSRLIRPQLRFHYAGDLPMYTTSEAFSPDVTANVDLDGALFPDMPWMVAADANTAALRTAVDQAWPKTADRRARLYAFGVDACRLIPALSQYLQMARDRSRRGAVNTRAPLLNGATGRLSIDADGRIRRELDWAQIRDGMPRLLPPTSTAITGIKK